LSSAPNTHHNNGEGDLMPGDPDATSAGGGQGSPVDADQSFPWSATMGNGIQASTSMAENYYHVHVFLGLIVNPTTFDAKNNEIAIPDGIGMVNPVGDFQDTDPSAPSYNTCTGTNPNVANFECYADSFYYIHTHDPSGAIHLEAPAPTCGAVTNYTVPCNTSVFTLGNVLDVWGISISPNNFGHYTGPVGVYVSPQKYAPCGSTSSGGACYTPSNEYTQFTGDPRTIHLYSHTVVWIVVGAQPPQPSALPNIQWFLSF
jgi:hypothetical protein